MGKSDVSVKLSSCSTSESQQPVSGIAVVVPGKEINTVVAIMFLLDSHQYLNPDKHLI